MRNDAGAAEVPDMKSARGHLSLQNLLNLQDLLSLRIPGTFQVQTRASCDRHRRAEDANGW